MTLQKRLWGMIMLLTIVMLMGISMVSAQFDKVATTVSKQKYPDITIKDKGVEQANFKLIYNTEHCGGITKCSALIQVTLKSGKSDILEGLKFVNAKDGKTKSIEYKVMEGKPGKMNTYSSLKSYSAGVFYIHIEGTKTNEEIIDWIPTVYGQEISEWATWSVGLNNNLTIYYKFDEGSGSLINNSVQNAFHLLFVNPFWTNGIINTGAKFRANGYSSVPQGEYAQNSSVNLGLIENYTFNFWSNMTSNPTDNGHFVGYINNSGVVKCGFAIAKPNSKGYYHLSISKCILAGDTVITLNINFNVWNMVTIKGNSTGTFLYQNGVLGNSTTNKVLFPINGNFTLTRNPLDFNGWGNVTIDEFGIWNRSVSDSEITDLYNSGIGISFTTNDITINSPVDNSRFLPTDTINFNASFVSLAGSKNATLFINGIFNQSRTITGLSNQTAFTGQFPIGNYSWFIQNCAIDDSCANSLVRYFNITTHVINSFTFNPTTTSGATENFALNATIDNTYWTGISVLLTYDNINYSMSQSGGLYQRSITVPSVTSNTNKSVYATLVLTNSSGTFDFLTTSSNQTIAPLTIDNCSSSSQRLFNFTMYDEESMQEINGTIEVYIKFFSLGTNNLISSYNASLDYVTGTRVSLCTAPFNSTYSMSYTIRHYGNSSLYLKKYRNVQMATITNTSTTSVIALYNLLGTSGIPFKIIVTGNLINVNGNSNIVVDVQKQYLPLGQFISVESPITDTSGEAVANIIPVTAVYNFILSYNNVILGTFNNFQLKCQNIGTGQCNVILNLAQASSILPDFTKFGNISYFYNLNNATKILSLQLSSTDGFPHNVTQRVVVMSTNNTICVRTNDGVSLSGTFLCSIPTVYQNTRFYSQLYSDGKLVATNYFDFLPATPDFYGADILIELLMFSTLVMMFLASPVLIVLGAIVGMGLSFILLFSSGSELIALISVIIFYVAAGFIALWQISRRS